MSAELWLTAAFCEQKPVKPHWFPKFVKDVFGIRPLMIELDHLEGGGFFNG